MNFYSNKGFIIPSVVIPRLIQERLDGLQVLKPMEETRQAMNVMYADCVHDSTIKSISNDKLHSVLKDVKLIVSRNILRQILTTCNKPKHNAQFFRRRNFQLRASNINGKVILTTVYTYENRPAPFPSYGRELRRIAAPYLTLHGDIVTDHHNADTSYYRVMEATLGNFSLLVRHYVDAVDEQGQPVLLKAARSLPESQVADYFLNMWGQLALSDNAYAWFVRVGREGIVSSKEKLYGTDLLARAGLTEEDGKVMLAKLVEVLKWITATVPHSGGQVILTYSPYTNAFGLKHPFERVDIMSPEVARMIS
ncbi:hypothetical protein EON65_28565 [archaeon]|nr:MAG: hypothetical protein EON65_28565 [archaeon]